MRKRYFRVVWHTLHEGTTPCLAHTTLPEYTLGAMPQRLFCSVGRFEHMHMSVLHAERNGWCIHPTAGVTCNTYTKPIYMLHQS